MGKIKTTLLISLLLISNFCIAAPSLKKGLNLTYKRKSATVHQWQFKLAKGYGFTQKPKVHLSPQIKHSVKAITHRNKSSGKTHTVILKIDNHSKPTKITLSYQVCYGKTYCFPPQVKVY